MNMENLFGKPEKDIDDAEELIDAIKESSSLKPEWAARFTAKEEGKKKKAEAELERLQNASNDETAAGKMENGG